MEMLSGKLLKTCEYVAERQRRREGEGGREVVWGGGQPHDLPPDCQWGTLGLAGWLPSCDSGLGPGEASV